MNGHSLANLDPLGLDNRPAPIELDPALYGFTEADLDKEFYLGTWRMSGFLSEDRPVQTLRQVLARLKQAYCGSVGYEYMHIADREQCNWLRERIETPTQRAYSKRRKLIMLDRLAWADLFEAFLSNKYSAAKRFGLEGAETLIPGMKELIDRASELDVSTIVIGMPHRGRLNVLANVVRKPLSQIFSEFAGGVRPSGQGAGVYTGSGDVKDHLGTSYNRPTLRGSTIHLSLVANPSHLEAVNTVVQGKVRAKQYYDKDRERAHTLPVLLHGDGAFAGQGIVYESLDMSQLPDYTVGGTIHIVVNNQVAFTTDPKASRSSPYCTDVAKGLGIPVFHVNGDDVEAVVHACELAVEWRQRWKRDVVVDIVCYRRYGHNEIDDPMFTQPLMYKVIRQHRNAHQQYADRLVREGTVSPDEVADVQNRVQSILEAEFDKSKSLSDAAPTPRDWLAEGSNWGGFKAPEELSRIRNTGVPLDQLLDVGRTITALPDGFTPHRAIARVYEARRAALESGTGLDWAMGEALAFGTLIREGFHVRLSGQDVERGTFSHRHAVLHDQATGAKYRPLCAAGTQGLFTVSNSSLSEFGVLGFELGYSMESPAQLVIWEAQFGDFANGAQVIFDQFLSSGEAKWLRQTGLVVLLPHGYDGQGPEHSSARLERYLQQVDEDAFSIPGDMSVDTRRQIQSHNWQVCNCTTPANYYHLLRRQVHRDFRKPLVVMAPKNLLRHPKCKSDLSEFDDIAQTIDQQVGTRFKRLIMDKHATGRDMKPQHVGDVQRVIFCTGKVYYELDAEREAGGPEAEKKVAIVRVEQLAPFPWDLVAREVRRYSGAELVWAQEEPKNMGAFTHVMPRLQTVLTAEGLPPVVRYAGRAPSAATATGFGAYHAMEQAALLKDALRLQDLK